MIKYLYALPLIYYNIYYGNYVSTKILNLFAGIYITKNFLNILLEIKIGVSSFIENTFYNNEFYLISSYLYTDLETKYDVTYYFKNNKIDNLDKDLIIDLCQYIEDEKTVKKYNNMSLEDLVDLDEEDDREEVGEKVDEDEKEKDRVEEDVKEVSQNTDLKTVGSDEYIMIQENVNEPQKPALKDLFEHPDCRLKIVFYYKKDKYILYYSPNLTKNFVPYPPYTEKIITDFRTDIVYPTHVNQNEKKVFYSLFNIDSKNIAKIEIDDKCVSSDMLRYFNEIKTPFNDFGLLYNCPIKLKWILQENNINISIFKKFYLLFLNVLFDEDTLTLKEHFINMTDADIDNILISDRMKEILQKKNI